jgi:hypothetical protein
MRAELNVREISRMAADAEKLEGYLPAEGRPLWNQSYYFNAYDPNTGVGCFVRAGFLEGAGSANTWLVFFRDGKPLFQRFNADLACPRERLSGSVTLGGMTLTSVESLITARITFATRDFSFDLTWRAMHPLVDAIAFGAGARAGATDSFATSLAHAHLEGSCFVSGQVTMRGGERLAFEGSGGRDIAAGMRDWSGMKHYRVAWPIFPDGTAIIGIHGFADARESFMSMVHDGERWTRMAETRDLFEFAADEMTVTGTRWDLVDEAGRPWRLTARPLFRCFLPADAYVLAEHIAEFTRGDGLVGYGLVECGFRLPWRGTS